MTDIPKDTIEDVRERAVLSDVVGQDVDLKRKGRSLVGLCPFHDDRNPSFDVRDDYGVYKCWACGQQGGVFDFVMQIRGIGFADAVRDVARTVGIHIPDGDAPKPPPRPLTEKQRHLMAARDFRDWERRRFSEISGQLARTRIDIALWAKIYQEEEEGSERWESAAAALGELYAKEPILDEKQRILAEGYDDEKQALRASEEQEGGSL